MWTIAAKMRLKNIQNEMMYNIADFLLVQLSLRRFTLIKSARSTDVCLNYISIAQFYQSDNQIIRYRRNISHFPVDIRLNIFGGNFG